ncbi:MAG: alpha-glucosidase C-terminal domain-containing protein [Spirochaetaceae bacterium]|nr:alpha-glucosidase C-terminal domain-containing protein [Spirochaetaceae bacterium]
MTDWARDAFFYHVYPLGYCGAPERNDFRSPPVPRLDKLTERLDRVAALGADALYLGPVFESSAHGYDTVDHRAVDRRLGDAAALRRLAEGLRARGMRLVFDGVFNHVGREHPWFLDLRERGRASRYATWFAGLDFDGRSPCGDPFSYEGWNGCHDLAKLELRNPETRAELVGAALSWIDDYGIDGLRLDAADCVDLEFQRELAAACRARKPDFWLMGEIVHGDYRRWAAPGLLDATTNYECWKGLWSSLKDGNYFEIAHSLRRQFGPGGAYEGLSLYSFADNHDVDRAASLVGDPALLYPLYCLLFTMPGAPSLYYGSEFGAAGKKEGHSDRPLRPRIEAIEAAPRQPELARAIARLAALRRSLPALRRGGYEELRVAPRQFAFARRSGGDAVLVALNADSRAADLAVDLPFPAARLRDALSEGETFEVRGGRVELKLHPTWARVLVAC